MSADAGVATPDDTSTSGGASLSRMREVIYRHTVLVRLTHWINALAIVVMIGTGLNIFNAHPYLYWGSAGADVPNGGHHWFAFQWPNWILIPGSQDLADARHWHFFFAWVLAINGLAYLAWSLAIRHVQRDLWPTVGDLKSIPRSVLDHIQLKHPTGEAAKRYNVLQRLAYLTLILLVLGMIATGLTMSPGINAFAPGLLDLFGGRQSARTIHFICASLITGFIVVHLVEVVLAGPINEVRSMITGRYAVPREHH